MIAYAYAKINWTLDVKSRLVDGYHEVDTIMQSVRLYDELVIEKNTAIIFECSSPELTTSDNLAMRAAKALRAYCGNSIGARMYLKKNIPVAAGLAGGSADAAAVLLAMDHLWQLRLTDDELLSIGVSLGADVPFCLCGGTLRAKGIGEILTELVVPQTYFLVLIKPCTGVSTAQIFERLDESTISQRPDNDMAEKALRSGDFDMLLPSLRNVLQPITQNLRPDIQRAGIALRENGALLFQMTGSGPTVFGLFAGQALAESAYRRLSRQYEECYLAPTTARGVEFIKG